jgi:uncharacterized membrane protein YccC
MVATNPGTEKGDMGLAPLTAWAGQHKAQLRLGLRITLASLTTFAIGRALGLTHAYWAVLTAVIVTQASVGGALKASRDRFVGSLGGAIWGVAVSLSIPHAGAWGLAVALTAAIAPLAVVTAINPAYRIAPITAIILLLTPTGQSAGPLASAISRLMEIGLGSVVALVLALLVLPERAHVVLTRAAAAALGVMGELAVALVQEPRDRDMIAALHVRVRKAIGAAEAAADEAARERRVSLSGGTDPEPLCRTLRRLHNDLIMIGRAAQEPLDGAAAVRLAEPVSHAASAIAAFLSETGAALEARRPAPTPARLDEALTAYGAAVTDLRHSGLTRDLPDAAVGRIFGLTFALEQLRLNLRDLTDRTGDWAGPSRS